MIKEVNQTDQLPAQVETSILVLRGEITHTYCLNYMSGLTTAVNHLL